MKKNRIGIIFAIFFVLIIAFDTVRAESIIDTQVKEDVYKASEDSSDFLFPFIRVSKGRMEINKEIAQDGIFISEGGIDISSAVNGLKMFYSADTIRLDADSEYSLLVSGGNVIVNGNVEKTTVIVASNSVTIDEGANIKGNLIIYTPQLNVNSQIDGNIIGYASTLNLNKPVNGQVRIKSYTVNVAQDANVNGEFYIETTNPDLSVEGANINLVKKDKSSGFKEYSIKLLNAVIMDIVIYLLVLIFVKKDNLKKVNEKLTDGKAIIINGLYGLLITVLSIVFGITMIIIVPKLGGAMIAFGVALAIIFALLKNIVVVTLITELAISKYSDGIQNIKPNRVVTAIMSFIVLELIETIPIVGQVIKFILYIVSMGLIACLLIKNKNNNDESKQEVIEAK